MIAHVLTALLVAATPAKQPPAGDPAMASVAAMLAKEGFSPAGLKTLSAQPPGLTTQLAAFRDRAGRIGAELAAAKAANDAEKFGAAMRAGDALNAEIQRARTDQMLRTLSALSPSDRTIFLRHIGPPAKPVQQGR